MKNYGYFSENGDAFVVTEPYTETPYTNVLYNKEGYLTEINQWAGGSSSVQFDDLETCTVTQENGKTLYLRNETTGKVWSIGAEPMHSDINNFECRHSDGYSTISSEFEKISAKLRIFVPYTGRCEIWSVDITNNSEESVVISVVPTVQLDMSGYEAVRFATVPLQSYVTTFRDEINGVYFKGGNPFEKGKPYDAFLSASEKVDYFSGDDRLTLAAPETLSYPYALIKGKNLDSRLCTSGVPFMAIQCKRKIEPNETVSISFMLGTCCNIEEAKEMTEVLKSNEKTEKLFNDTLEKINEARSTIKISTPDEKVNRMINIWLKKGMEYCLRKKDATRDNLQFALGLTYVNPDAVRDTIRLAMRYQYCDGHTVRSWKPLDETYYSDGQIWLVLATCDYIKYSGDIAFLDEEIPYFDKGKGSVLEHLEMGVTRLNEDRGPNNLCLIRFADWNDALNLCDEKAESTFTSMGLAWCANELSSLFEYLKKQADADKYKKIFEDIKHIINEKCWDSEGYYIRGFSNGKKIGASEAEGSKIYVNPQSWAILSDVTTEERIPQILDAVEKYLETDLGYLVNYPAYQHYDKELGRISFQVPGTTENGAVYCHATGFKINADVKLGSGSKALESIRKIMPDSDCNPSVHSGALPYALTSCYCTHPVIYGKAGRPWLTGTQGWLFNCVIEGLLGIKKTYGGFLIRPSFPEEWENAQCSIQKENTTYNFKLKRTGKNKIEVNGEETGCFIPFCNDEAVCIDIQI